MLYILGNVHGDVEIIRVVRASEADNEGGGPEGSVLRYRPCHSSLPATHAAPMSVAVELSNHSGALT